MRPHAKESPFALTHNRDLVWQVEGAEILIWY